MNKATNGKPRRHRGEVLDQAPPSAPDSERALLSGTLYAQRIDPDISLPGREFSDERNGAMWEVLCHLDSEGTAIDSGAVLTMLKQHRQWGQYGLDTEYVAEVAAAAGSIINRRWHAEQIHLAYVKRTVSHRAEILLQQARGPCDLAELQNSLKTLSEFVASDQARGGKQSLPQIEDAHALCDREIPLPPELIKGVLHQGSKLSFGGASKGFKTWMLEHLALCVAYGIPFLGCDTKCSRVLLVDLELPKPFCRRRLITLQSARGIAHEPGRLDVWNLRGYSAGHSKIFPRAIERVGGNDYGLVVLDPIYKLYGDETDENSARDVAALMNSIEGLAVETGAAVAFSSHFSKGNQLTKNAIDRVSGSGVFARDPDSLLNLTAHDEGEGFYTLDFTLRNFPPVEPFVVKWNPPLFDRRNDLDPTKLRKAGRPPQHSADRLLDVLVDGMKSGEWEEAAKGKGIKSNATYLRLREELETSGKVEKRGQGWRNTHKSQ